MQKTGASVSEDITAILPQLLQSSAYRQQQRWREALACLDAAYAAKPRLLALSVERALVMKELGEYAAAVAELDRFLSHAPQPEIANLRQEVLDTAFATLAKRLEANEKDVPARLQRILLYEHLHQHPLAQNDCEQILLHNATHAGALNHLGSALLAQNRHDEALIAYRQALAAAPHSAAIHCNHGNVLQQLGHLDAAEQSYRCAIAIAPGLAEAHMEIGHCRLQAGESTGWQHIEWRWRTQQMRHAGLRTQQPLWLGNASAPLPEAPWPVAEKELRGKTILVWAEQGLGDTLQFVRYVPRLCRLATRVILRVPATLLPLLRHIDPRIEVIDDRQPLPPFDIHCPLLSLPLALGSQAIPPPLPSLRADPDTAAEWSARLGSTPFLRIGIAWAGRQFGQPNPTRDIPLAALHSLAIPGAEIVSLQKEIPAGDAASLTAWPELRRFEAELRDCGETAALIANLDLVISADTAVAHLAASLGKPCWLMLRFASEWRWLRQRRDSPWYPSLSIFRQRRAGEWRDVVAEIHANLSVLAT